MVPFRRLTLAAALVSAAGLAGCNSNPTAINVAATQPKLSRSAQRALDRQKVAAAQPAAAANPFDLGSLFDTTPLTAPAAAPVAALSSAPSAAVAMVTPTPPEPPAPPTIPEPVNIDAGVSSKLDGNFSAIYGEMKDGAFTVPAVKPAHLNPAFMRKKVPYATSEPAGSIVIDPAAHYLYYVEGGGQATRYGVGVGREGFIWAGDATIKNKQEWPDWYPPKEMVDRRPDLQGKMSKLQSGEGMHGGPSNPLGARAMYLWQGDKDTLFRIHGTNEPWSIGHSESSGCIRMINQDAIDLYNKVQPGARVVVLGSRGAMPIETAAQRPEEKAKKKVAAR